ncbi:MAG: 3-phosphoshikimate 1-carboxyvinyltransferase [Planctomycetaceae bacterium]|nr:3-phosphoshikimate 1-carboxyvinyltransferase [Planctomycetaceae bacterium]
MPDSIEIQPVAGPLDARIRPPGSKSITNRALVCAALAEGRSELRGALDSEDTRVMLDSLRRLGLAVEARDDNTTLAVDGWGGPPACDAADLFVANSGTTMRFLTALASTGRGEFCLDGIARMRERPIADLADALNQLGASVRCDGPHGCPPVQLAARGLAGGTTRIRGDISSQFLSGLLMAAPCAASPVNIAVAGELVSQPYVTMTLRVMEAFGAQADAAADFSSIKIPAPQRYSGRVYEIEPDASAASYFFAAAALVGGRVTVEGLSRDALQGDVAFCDCLAEMGCQIEYGDAEITVVGASGPLRGVDVDMNGISDTVQTLAVVAAFAEGPTRIRRVGHVRHKETDRIAAVATELRKLGAAVDETDDGLRITPQTIQPTAIDTYNDHRMAMSFAVAGLRQPGIVIRDPGCTEKTYPHFFRDLAAVAHR